MYCRRRGMAFCYLECLSLFIFALIIYATFLNAWYFADDFQLIFSGSGYSLVDHFIKKSPNNQFYRPLQNAFLAFSQQTYGIYSTWPVHLLQLILHSCLGFITMQVARFCGCSRRLSFFAGLFTIAVQGSVHSVVSNDTLSQVGGTVFGYASLWLLLLVLDKNKSFSLLSITLFAGAIFFKETSISFLTLIPLLVLLLNYSSPLEKKKWIGILKQIVIVVVPYIFVFAIYLFIRQQIVTSSFRIGPGLYDFNFGANIIKNFVQLTISLLSPVSTVLLMKAIYSQAWVLLLIYLLPMLCLIGFSVFTLVDLFGLRKGLTLLGAWFAIVFCSFIPVVFLNHVSELYVYNATLIYVVALIWLVQRSKQRGYKVVVLIALLLHGASSYSKAQHMHNNGERARRGVEQIVAYGKSLPLNSTITLAKDTESRIISYSVFLIKGENLIGFNYPLLSTLMNRKDITVRKEGDAKGETKITGIESFAFVRDDGKVDFKS